MESSYCGCDQGKYKVSPLGGRGAGGGGLGGGIKSCGVRPERTGHTGEVQGESIVLEGGLGSGVKLCGVRL